MAVHSDERGRRAPTPKALSSLSPVPDGFRILPDPLHGQPLMRVSARPAEVRLLLARSRESAQAGEPTQDYLAVRYDPHRLTFAVADGVGSSFLGDVAAQILAAHLADWLAAAPARRAGRSFDAALSEFLSGLSQEVMDQVANWPLPDSVSGFVRAALDQQRGYGSEAMFACGVVDFAGGPDATVTVAWLGDTQVRVFLRDGSSSDHSGQTADRWSSRLGSRGPVHSRAWPVAEVTRVIVCTDGLLPEIDAAVELADRQLGGRLGALAQRPGNDDMALIDVGLTPRAMPPGEAINAATLWRRLTEEPHGRHARPTVAGAAWRRLMRAVGPAAEPPAAPRHAAPAGPTPPKPEPAQGAEQPASTEVATPVAAPVTTPVAVQWHRTDRGPEVTWSPVPGADGYAVQVCREPTFDAPLLYAVRGLTFTVPPIPAPVFVRVRCIVDGEPGPWSTIYDISGDLGAEPS